MDKNKIREACANCNRSLFSLAEFLMCEISDSFLSLLKKESQGIQDASYDVAVELAECSKNGSKTGSLQMSQELTELACILQESGLLMGRIDNFYNQHPNILLPVDRQISSEESEETES